MGKTICDWNALKAKYVTTDITLDELADGVGIGRHSIYKKSSEEGWVAERKKYRRNVTKKTIETAERENVKKLSRLISITDDTIEMLGQAVSCMMKDEERDIRAIREATATLKDITPIFRNLNNIPTEAEAEQLSMAREKLAIERKRADIEERDATVRVVLDDRMKEWSE